MKRKIQSVLVLLLLMTCIFIAEGIAYKQPENVQQKKKTTEKAKVSADIDWEYMDYYGLDSFETSLPVLYLDTKEQKIIKEGKIWGTLDVIDSINGEKHSILETPDYQAAVTVNYRGASSYSQFDKKQYRIKFYKKKGSSAAKDYKFLGMGANSEWVLNGPFLDKTFMRNRLAYSLGKEMFEWAPDSRFVELFVDGKYQGVYLAVEPVTNGESRLRLSEFGLLPGATAYMVKRDRIGSEANPLEVYGKTTGKTNNDLTIEYPTKNKITSQQRTWIAEDISKFEKVLYSDYFADSENGYAKYIDVDSFVDYFILNEVMMNHDAGNLSTYIYKELGGKLQFTIWDYNNCYDNYQWFAQDYEKFYLVKVSWFDRLLLDKNFVDKVIIRYEELRKNTLSQDYMYQKLDEYEQELGDAVERNYAVWGYTFYLPLLSGIDRDSGSYEEAIMQLREAIAKRFEFLDNHMADLYENCIN